MKIIESNVFDAYWKNIPRQADDPRTEKTVKKVIADVRKNGDTAIKKYASKWDKSSPSKLEVPFSIAKKALDDLRASEPSLVGALELAALNIKNFACKQREQFADFEVELNKNIITGQRIIHVERAGVYIPGGRFPLFSSVLMCMIPAFCAGVNEVILSSSPAADGLPDKKTLAAAIIAANICGKNEKDLRIFSIGGAQAIAALAIGTESVPRVDVIAGPGNRFVAAAKKQLFGEVGIDFIAGPSDILVITDDENTLNLAAVDMIGQAEHDPDARARALVSSKEIAEKIAACIESRLNELPENNKKTARASLNAGGIIVIYKDLEDMVRIANEIAPEHLELQTLINENIIPKLKNYGSLFIGAKSAEVLGDYSAGVNHTLPTETCARFTGGLSVRHFLKTVTTLRCTDGEGFEKARNAAEIIGRAEGLEAHAKSAAIRKE